MENKCIIISPYSSFVGEGKSNPKNYPKEKWVELIKLIKQEFNLPIIQVGLDNEEPLEGISVKLPATKLEDLKIFLDVCVTWISVDNFFHHFAAYYNKPGVVLFSYSDPLIYGHEINVNLLKDRKYLRKGQFHKWDMCEIHQEDPYISPNNVIKKLKKLLFK